ncbi:unnamed protein product [Prorocentrum cordatum]|uniref:Meiosis-specific nuclear structural protein 1 n=1 Tax=Prorocentrum cordatum TaxID=2364126 RepID=A0ABN9TZZ9_9DINO|nr:unnamed protein product [Polarella glacialis]
MERYKREIAKSAAAERSLLQNYEVKLKTNVNDEKLEADIKKSREIRNQNEIMQQIERNKDRRAHERREHIENASMHAYPLFSETFIDEAEVARIRKNQREQWREDLKHQMVTQDILKNIEEVRQRDLVQKQKTKHLVSMQRERGAEQQRLRRQGKELVAAWDKDLQLKSFRKAVLQGEQPPHTPGAPYA